MGSRRNPKNARSISDRTAGIRSVLDSLRRIVRVSRVSSRAAEKHTGLSAAQLFVLQQLHPDQPLSLNALAERTYTHQSSVCVVVERLVEKKLVARKQSSNDGRRVELSLTKLGGEVRGLFGDPFQTALIATLQKMNAPKRLQLARLLGELIDNAGLSDASPPPMLDGENTDSRSRKNIGA